MKQLITLDFHPGAATSLNYHGPWKARWSAQQELKTAVYALARSQGVGPFKRVRVTITYVFAQHRNRDPDNWMGMMKGGIDGLVSAGVVKDDSSDYVEYAPIKFVVDKDEAPQTIIEIEAL